MAVNLEQINLKFTASAGNVSKTFSALETRLGSLNKALNGLNVSKVDAISSSMSRMASAMSNLGNNTNADKAIRSLATSLNRMGQIDTASVERAASAMSMLGNSMRTFPTIDPMQAQSLSALATSLNAFGRVKSVAGVSGIATFATNIREMMTSLEGMDAGRLEQIATAIRQLAEALNILGRAKVGTAITNLPLLAKEMESLMQSLARAPTVSQSVIQMTQALAQLSSNGAKVGTATNGLNRALNNTHIAGRNGSKGLDIFSRSAKSQKAHIKSLASVVGGLIAKYWILWRAIQMMGNMAGVASNLVEVQNVVDHTFGQMSYKLDDFTKTSINDFGLSTLAAKQYASRFQSMGMAMGITNNQVAKSADFVSAHMTDEAKALYNTSDSLADMSINLTKLAADYASFYDVSTDEAFEKFQSVMTGQTRPLRAYGIDLTQATLKEFALKNGLDADIASMTQAEKAMLRYQYIMAQSSHVMTDFARTSDTYHNTLTKLKANFQTLKGTIGTSLMNLFKPIMVVVNNAIVVINQFAKAVGDSLGKILGWRYEVGSGAVEMEDMAEFADDTATGLGNAGKAAKELKRQLQGFDELNNLTSPDDNSGGGSGGSGGGLGGASGASNMAGKWVKEESLFESDWDTWFKLGRGISEAWTEGLNSIDWDSVYSAFDDFGTNLASFLNGLITPDLFGAVGKTIAGSLNSAFHFLNSFGNTFDWNNFGNSIASGINGFFENFDFVLAAKAINKISTGILDSLITAVEKVKWEKIGESITEFIKNLDLGDIAKKLSKLANSIITGITKALNSADWSAVGKEIGKMITNLDLGTLALNLIKLAGAIISALGEAFVELAKENPLGASLLALIAGTKITGAVAALEGVISKSIGKVVSLKTGIGISLAVASVSLMLNGNSWESLIMAPVSAAVAGKMFGASTKTSVGIGLVVGAVSLLKDSGQKFDKGSLMEFIGENALAAFESVLGLKALGASNIVSGAIATFAVSFNVFFNLGKSDAQKAYEEAEKEAEAQKKENINAKDAEVKSKVQEYNENIPGLALTTDLETRKKMIEEYNSKINDLGTHLQFIKEKSEGADGSFKEWVKTLDGSGKTIDGTKEKTSVFKQAVDYVKSSVNFANKETSTFGVTTTGLGGTFHSMSADLISDSTIMSADFVKNLGSMDTQYTKSSNLWQDKDVNFTVDSEATSTDTVKSNYAERSGSWKGKWANFAVDPLVTKVKTIQEALKTRQDNWKGKWANFAIDSTITKVNDIITNRNTRQNVWTGKTANYSVNTSATNINAVVTANSAYQSKWTDKVANYAIKFGVDADKVKTFINSDVFGKINGVFAKIPILKGFSIPYMATGGVIDNATVAMIGENGSEAVVPLERNTQWLGKMAGMIANEIKYDAPSYNGSVYTPASITARVSEESTAEQNALLREEVALLRQIANKELTISEREVFNATRNASNNYYNRTGNSPFVF